MDDLFNMVYDANVQDHLNDNKKYNINSYFQEEPRRFLPEASKYPYGGVNTLDQLMGDFRGAAGMTNKLTGQVSFMGKPDLSTLVHEYGHIKNMNDWDAKRKSILELFGGEQSYQDFLNKIEGDYNKHYNFRRYIPFVGSQIREDELMSYLQGDMVDGHVSRRGFEQAINKIHPMGSRWFDIISSPTHFRSSGQR